MRQSNEIAACMLIWERKTNNLIFLPTLQTMYSDVLFFCNCVALKEFCMSASENTVINTMKLFCAKAASYI